MDSLAYLIISYYIIYSHSVDPYRIHGRLVKIEMSPSVIVIYLRTDHKLKSVFLIINKRRERMYWEGNSKNSKLKKHFFTRVNTPTTHNDSNILLMQPENLLYYPRSATRKINHRSLQSGSRNRKLFSDYLVRRGLLTATHNKLSIVYT